MMAPILEIFQTVCFCITCVILVLCQNRLFSMWREMRAELFWLRKWIYRERRRGSRSMIAGTLVNVRGIDSDNSVKGSGLEKAD